MWNEFVPVVYVCKWDAVGLGDFRKIYCLWSCDYAFVDLSELRNWQMFKNSATVIVDEQNG